jgi:hypothetical protein
MQTELINHQINKRKLINQQIIQDNHQLVRINYVPNQHRPITDTLAYPCGSNTFVTIGDSHNHEIFKNK